MRRLIPKDSNQSFNSPANVDLVKLQVGPFLPKNWTRLFNSVLSETLQVAAFLLIIPEAII